METMWSVLIVYKMREMRPYICLSQFFRLCGFVVGDGRWISDRETLLSESEKYLFTLSLYADHEEDNTEKRIYDISGELPSEYDNEGNWKNEQNKCNQTLSAALGRINEKGIITENEYAVLQEISKLYVENYLLTAEYNCQHYSYDNELMIKARSSYRKVENILFEKFKQAYVDMNKEALPFIQFSRCYCAGRIQEIEDTFEMAPCFDFYKIVSMLNELYSTDNRFVSGFFLTGQFFERKKRWSRAIQNYGKFIDLSQRRGVEEAYYRLGKIVEENEGLGAAEKYYELSETERSNYRAKYKIAVFYEFCKEDYSAAEKSYLELVEYFERILSNGEMQPQELEYLFKLYFRCGRLYLRRLDDMQRAEEYFRRAEEIGNIEIGQMGFLRSFYGPEADSYLQRTIGRFPMYQIRINRDEAEYRGKS